MRVPLRLLVLLVLLASCAPPGQTPNTESQAPSAPATAATKTLIMGRYSTNEPTAAINPFGTGGTAGGADFPYIFHAGLTLYDPQSNLVPWMATKVPTIEDGDWALFPDGHMEVTWKLRPGITWHDGTLLSADDFVFGMQLRRDPRLPFPATTGLELYSGITAPDAQTLIVSWKAPYPYANVSQPGQIVAVPAHVVREAYEAGDPQALVNHRYWTDQFVGLGPYRLGEWVLGSQMQALAYDGYFLGRPKIDRIEIRFLGDTTVVYTNLLANQIDVVSIGTFEAGQFLQVKESWADRGEGTALAVFSGARNLKFQFRNPQDPWVDRRVREAMIHMLDRQTMSEELIGGLGGAADSAISPSNLVYPLVQQRGVPHRGYDLAQAQRLMESAGWQRGAEGSYRSATTGEPFSVDLREKDIEGNVKESAAVSAQWRAAGLSVNQLFHRNGSPDDPMLSSTTRGLMALPLREVHLSFAAFSSGNISSEATRWRGNNVGGYSNPEFDRLYDQSLVTLDTGQRRGLIADLVKVEAMDAGSINLFYDMAQQSIIFRKGIRGPGLTSIEQLAPAWNIHTWDIE